MLAQPTSPMVSLFSFSNPIPLSYTFYVGHLSPDKKAIIPTVTDNLYAECKTHVPVAVLGVSFEPITTDNATAGQINGELTWGV